MNSRVKLSARAALCGSYAKILPLCAAVMLVFVLFSVSYAVLERFLINADDRIIASAAIIGVPLFVAIISPLSLLLQVRCVCLARGMRAYRAPHIGFSDALKACDLHVRLFGIKLFWFAAFEVLPVFSVLIFLYQIKKDSASLKAAYVIAAGLFLLALAGFFCWLVFIQRYSKSMFYLACYKDFTAGDAINESVRKTKNSLAEIFLFKLGFVPWMLLCVLVLPAMFVIPYYKQSVTCLFLGR